MITMLIPPQTVIIDPGILINTTISVTIGSIIAPFIFYFVIKKLIIHDILKTISTELEKPQNQIILKQIKEKVVKGMFGIDINELSNQDRPENYNSWDDRDR